MQRAEQSLGELRATVEAIAARDPQGAEWQLGRTWQEVSQTLRDEGYCSLDATPL